MELQEHNGDRIWSSCSCCVVILAFQILATIDGSQKFQFEHLIPSFIIILFHSFFEGECFSSPFFSPLKFNLYIVMNLLRVHGLLRCCKELLLV